MWPKTQVLDKGGSALCGVVGMVGGVSALDPDCSLAIAHGGAGGGNSRPQGSWNSSLAQHLDS